MPPCHRVVAPPRRLAAARGVVACALLVTAAAAFAPRSFETRRGAAPGPRRSARPRAAAGEADDDPYRASVQLPLSDRFTLVRVRVFPR